MPTAINVKEEKKAKTNIVRFETSTSPNWKDIKMFIRKNFFKTLTQLQKIFFIQLQIQKDHYTKNYSIDDKYFQPI